MVIKARFDGRCSDCGVAYPAGTAIEWTRGVRGAKHATTADCAAARAGAATVPPPPGLGAVSLAPVADFLAAAQARGLRYPKARFLAPGGGEFRLSVAGAQSQAPGSIQVVLDEQWIGRVTPTGVVVGKLARRPDLIAALLDIAANPAEAAAAYGALMCRCSFCDRPLTDDGSVEVGYGPICAARYGLPHVPKGSRDLTAVAS